MVLPFNFWLREIRMSAIYLKLDHAKVFCVPLTYLNFTNLCDTGKASVSEPYLTITKNQFLVDLPPFCY